MSPLVAQSACWCRASLARASLAQGDAEGNRQAGGTQAVRKQLTLRGMNELQEMPDLIGLTALGSLTIGDCSKFRVMPRRIGKLGALRELLWLDELQEMPDLTGLTALEGSWTH